jgi:hypothetical protein
MNDAVKTLLTPAVEALGYELVLVQLLGRGGDQLLRLYIDAPAGIGVEDCERVSRQVAALSHPGLLLLRRPYDDKGKRFAASIPSTRYAACAASWATAPRTHPGAS